MTHNAWYKYLGQKKHKRKQRLILSRVSRRLSSDAINHESALWSQAGSIWDGLWFVSSQDNLIPHPIQSLESEADLIAGSWAQLTWVQDPRQSCRQTRFTAGEQRSISWESENSVTFSAFSLLAKIHSAFSSDHFCCSFLCFVDRIRSWGLARDIYLIWASSMNGLSDWVFLLKSEKFSKLYPSPMPGYGRVK